MKKSDTDGNAGGDSSSGVEYPANSAEATALAVETGPELRVPCYCEENVWRLTYRMLNHLERDNKSNSNNGQTTNKAYHVAFVSNPSKCVAFFHQRASSDRDGAVFWDYHVLLLEETGTEEGTLVWDMDSFLPFPSPLRDYINQSFSYLFDNNAEIADYAPLFRVVSATTFLEHFMSDRSHMWDESKQKWRVPPPQYDCILSPSFKRSPDYKKVLRRSSSNCEDVSESINATIEASFGKLTNLMTYVSMTTQEATEQLPEEKNSDDSMYGKVYTLSKLVERFG